MIVIFLASPSCLTVINRRTHSPGACSLCNYSLRQLQSQSVIIIIFNEQMIKPKKSALWSTLGLKNHIKSTFDENWGSIVESGRKSKPSGSVVPSRTQRSISEYNISQKLKEQHVSFLKNKEPTQKRFLEDDLELSEQSNTATVKKQQNIEEQKQEWQQLALEFSTLKQHTNDQTFSPISRLKSKQQTEDATHSNQPAQTLTPGSFPPPKSEEEAQKDICRLQGHENNQIKFICTHNECPYKFHKACAHCVIKLHAKHVESMKEIEHFEHTLEDNFKKAEELVRKSQQLLQQLQFPYEDFFSQLKEVLTTVVDDVERRLVHKNRERVRELIRLELEQIQQFNAKFEAYQNNRLQNQQHLNMLLSDESLEQFSTTLGLAKEKLKPNFNVEELKTLIESNLMTLMGQRPANTKENTTPTQTSRVAQTARDQSPQPFQTNRTSSFNSSHKLILSPRSPLNVFNHNINVSRHPPKILSTNPTTAQVVYYRSGS